LLAASRRLILQEPAGEPAASARHAFLRGFAVSASATTPVPANRRLAWRRLLARLLLAAIALALSAALLLPHLVVPALVAVAVAIAFFLHQAFRAAPVRRLVPVGMSSAFSVKLTGTSLIVGRLPCCNIAIPLPTVSAHHCRLYQVKSSWYIEDLDSRNGTRVNQKRIGKRRLRVGDRISIGELEFQVQ